MVRAGVQFEKANSSNDPRNQEVISRSRDTPIVQLTKADDSGS
jgi:hypothetical protein